MTFQKHCLFSHSPQNTLLTEFRRIQLQVDTPFASQGALIDAVSHFIEGEVISVVEKQRTKNKEKFIFKVN